MIYAFDEFELDTSRNVLRRGQGELKVEPRVLDVLKYLVANHDRVVTKYELLGEVWRGEAVSEAVLPVCVGKLRRALGQQRGERQPIDTDHGVGYRFASDVHVLGRAESARRSSPVSAPPAPIDPLVGREAVVQHLWSALQQAQAGHVRLVLLSGEAGIGKSRIAQELAAIAERQSTATWTARCLEQQGAPAFWPWLSVLRHALSELSKDAVEKLGGRALERLATLLPELADLVASPQPSAERKQEAKFALYDTIARLLREACASRAHLLVLDDLHWADPASIDLVHFLGSQLGACRLLILGTLRSEALDAENPGRAPLKALIQSRVFERIELSALSRDEVGRYVEAVTDEQPEEPLLDALYTKTGGNPFFMREALRLMLDAEGKLPRGGSVSVPLTQQVRDVIKGRLQQLGADGYRLLACAAVIGSRFDLPLLERVAGLGPERLLGALDEALRLHLVAPETRDAASYRFTHELFRETLYLDLGVADRVKHHGAIAEALETASFGRDVLERLSEMSLHFQRALPGGHAQKAFACSLEAADLAMRSYAFEDAAMLFARALEADDYAHADGRAPDLARRCEILIALSNAYAAAFRFGEAFESAARAIEAARHSGQPALFARAVLGRPQALMGLERAQLGVVDEALAGLPPHETELRARLLCRIASTVYADPALRRRALRQATELETIGSGLGLTTHLETLAAEVLLPRLPSELDRQFTVATELSRSAGDGGRADLAFLARRALWIAALRRGHAAAADAALEAAERALQTFKHPIMSWNMRLMRLQHALMQGRLSDVEAGWPELLPVTRRQDGVVLLMTTLVLHGLLSERGYVETSPLPAGQPRPDLRAELRALSQTRPLDRARLQGLLRTGTEAARRTLDHPATEAGNTLFLYALGERETARQQFELLLPADPNVPPHPEQTLVELGYLAQLAIAFGDTARARIVHERLRPHAQLHICDDLGFYYGAVALHLGGLARTLGRATDAASFLERAVAAHEALGARPALIYSRLALCELWIEQPDTRTRRHALTQLEQLAADADALGMESAAARARSHA